MIANFGFGVLVISFLVTLYSVFAAIYGERRQDPCNGGKRAACHVAHMASAHT